MFRIACEVTLQLLRDNKDSLMNVLDAFVHDPLVEWEDEKRKRVRRLFFFCLRVCGSGLLLAGEMKRTANRSVIRRIR